MRSLPLGIFLSLWMIQPVFGEQPGNAAPLNAETSQPARELGPWSWSAKTGLKLDISGRQKDNFWVYRNRTARDGILRAVFELGQRPDFSLIFRGSFPDNLAAVDGYSVSIHRSNVEIHRWEGGYAAPVTPSVRVKKMPKWIEIEVSMTGTKFRIRVLDAKTRRECASFSVDDAALNGTEIGCRAHRKQDKDTSLRGIEFTAAETQTAARDYSHPDAYIRQHPFSFVIVPEERIASTAGLSACKEVRHANIEKHGVFRCSHEAMTGLVDEHRRLPEGLYWTEPRHAFIDSEYRTASSDLNCEEPMRCSPGKPLDPNRSAKDADMAQAYIDAYAGVCQKRVRHVRIEPVGTTYLGHEIRAIVLSNADPDKIVPRVLFNGAHHGIELLAADMAFDVLEQLCETTDPEKEKRYADWLDKTEVWIIPVVNLDGTDMFFHVSNHLGRKNGRGVFTDRHQEPMPAKAGRSRASGYYRYHPNDIAVGAGVDPNRNYPLRWGATGEISSSARHRDYWYRGEYAASEPEVQAMMHLFHTEQFASSISFHTVSTRILSPYSIDALQNPPHDKDFAWQLALRMSKAAGVQVNGKTYEVVKNLYSVDGTDQDWFRMISGSYAYLIEGPLHNPTGEKRRTALEKTRPAWETFLESSTTATTARVRDASGAPLIAEIIYSDVPRLNNEHWLTRAADGTHTMLCSNDREITAVLYDGTKQTKTAECRSGKTTVVDFTFPKPDGYRPDNAFCTQNLCQNAMIGIDAICDLRNGQAPHLPAQRFCLIGDHCISAGVGASFGPQSSIVCDPRENNRGWTLRK